MQLTQGDYGNSLSFVLQDGNGNLLNLTGASLVFKVQSAQDPNGVLAVNGSMVIDAPTLGTCHYVVGQNDFTAPGTYLAAIVVTVSGTSVTTFPGIQIIVQPALPKSIN